MSQLKSSAKYRNTNAPAPAQPSSLVINVNNPNLLPSQSTSQPNTPKIVKRHSNLIKPRQFVSSDSNSSIASASKFVSFFHIADFIAILSGTKVAFIDPHEHMAPDKRSYVAIFFVQLL